MRHSGSCESTLSMLPIGAAESFCENDARNLNLFKDMISNNSAILDQIKGGIGNIIKIEDYGHDDGVCATKKGPEGELMSTISNNDKMNDNRINIQKESTNVIVHQNDTHALYTPISTPTHRVSCTPSLIDDPLPVRDDTFCIRPRNILDSIDQDMDCKEDPVDLQCLFSPSSIRLQGIHSIHSAPTTIEHEGGKFSAKGIRSSFDSAPNLKLQTLPATLTDQKDFSTESIKHEPAHPKSDYGPRDLEDHHTHLLFSHDEVEQKELDTIEAHRLLLVGLSKRVNTELESLSTSSSNSNPQCPHQQADATGNTISSETLPSIQDYSCYHRFLSFKNVMMKSRASHNQLVLWDRKQGMKSSHCKTMTASKFSRKRSLQFTTLRLKYEIM